MGQVIAMSYTILYFTEAKGDRVVKQEFPCLPTGP